jgi:hypothetical protein
LSLWCEAIGFMERAWPPWRFADPDRVAPPPIGGDRSGRGIGSSSSPWHRRRPRRGRWDTGMPGSVGMSPIASRDATNTVTRSTPGRSRVEFRHTSFRERQRSDRASRWPRRAETKLTTAAHNRRNGSRWCPSHCYPSRRRGCRGRDDSTDTVAGERDSWEPTIRVMPRTNHLCLACMPDAKQARAMTRSVADWAGMRLSVGTLTGEP